MKARNAVVIAALISLTGCATALKPELTDDGYKQFALGLVAGERCAIRGYTDVSLVAFSNSYLRHKLNSYSYDPVRIESETARVSSDTPSSTPTQEECNMLALRVAELQQQRDINIADSIEQQQEQQQMLDMLRNNTPKATYCNKYGAQTICNTY